VRSMWGLFFEGPVRRAVRETLGKFLGVPGSQFPIRDAISRRLGR
jgi:hypothetical protein